MSAFGGKADIQSVPIIRVIGANSISVLARISDVTRTSLDFREVPADIRPIMSTFETLRPARYTAMPKELG